MKRVILITGAEHYDASSQTSREPDDEVLRQALLERGIDVQVAVWNDLNIDWKHMAYGAIVVIRSCWDYHRDREGFLAWSERIARMTTLLNPVEVVRWNTHKRYLHVLARHGIPTIPTIWLPRGTSLVLADLLAERRWSSAVIKPAVSTNAYATLFVDAASLAEGLAQKILRMAAKLLGMCSSSSFLFARVDLIDDSGTLRLMELELVEPRLRLADASRGKERLVAALAAHGVASRRQLLPLAS